jgi:predicted small metal-binding protein
MLNEIAEGEDNFYKEIYYIVLELPFNTLLVFKDAFTKFEDAEDIVTDLPWFSIWTKNLLNQFKGRTVFTPIKSKKNPDNTYTILCEFEVNALTENEALLKIRSHLKNPKNTDISSLRTNITKAKISLNK